MRLLLDEMYPAALADALADAGIDTATVAALRLSGASDEDVFRAARTAGRAVLTENVADFTRLAADLVTSGHHHAGLLIALSSRFSRRPSGIGALVDAVRVHDGEDLEDRVVYLRPSEDPPRRRT